MFDLTGKVALVTGAARGMGKADALALASQGAKVVVTDVSQEGCDAVAEIINRHGHDREAVAHAMDVTSMTDIDRVITATVAHFGRLDILVNNAGVYEQRHALDITEASWDRMLTIDLKGQFFCAQRAAREMLKNKWGRIINISSISSGGAGVGVQDSVHYTAAKAGVIGMTEALAVDLAQYGILVNAIAPGGIDTPMANPEGKPRSELDRMMGRTLLKRIGTPEEVAAAVVFLASTEASYITGTTLYVDGGWLAT